MCTSNTDTDEYKSLKDFYTHVVVSSQIDGMNWTGPPTNIPNRIKNVHHMF